MQALPHGAKPADRKQWPDLSQAGYEVVVARFTQDEDERAVLVRGPGRLAEWQERQLTAAGFRRIAGPGSIWARRGNKFTLSELRAAFPGVSTTDVSAQKTTVLFKGSSPFAQPGAAAAMPSAPASRTPPAPASVATQPITPPTRVGLLSPFGRARPAPATPGQTARAPEPRGAPTVPPAPRRVEAPAVQEPVAPVPARPASSLRPQRPVPAAAPAPEPPSPEMEFDDEPLAAVQAINPFQARYRPKSRIGTPISMVPLEMAAPIQAALDRLEQQVGNIDEWVAERLAWSVDEMSGFLSPEQVDAVALALSAVDQGRGFILADQTGLGKGRVLAAVARAQAVSGRRVVFLTEKANLFTDFWRDVRDIGSDDVFGTPFLLNIDSRIIDQDSPTGAALVEAPKKKVADELVREQRMPDGCGLLMATYSQFNRRGSPKAAYLAEVARGAMVICDESHNAIGDSNTSDAVARALEGAHGAVYSSATFAKDATNLAAYGPVLPPSLRREDMSKLMRMGGASMAEALAQMLAEDGVLIRREHDLSNINIAVVEDVDRRERNRALADQLAPILSVMGRLARRVEEIAEDRSEENAARVEKLKDAKDRRKAREKWYVENFGGVLSAVVRQFVTALSVDLCVERAVARLEAGEKPVVVIENTMEALMRELAGGAAPDGRAVADDLFEVSDGAEEGEAPVSAAPDFRATLTAALDRISRVIVRRAGADPERLEVEDAGVHAAVESVRNMISRFPNLSMSPIDDLRERIEEEGRRRGLTWKTDEISARAMRVEGGRYVAMPPRDRNVAISGFNNGAIDALVVTRAGSTGLSLHASERVKDRRPRCMIELQVPQNVVERIQFWGRVNRRGQVVEPTFETLSSGLPLQMRNLAMQNRKVEELSANVTASSQSATTMDVPDLLDTVGNDVARRMLEERPALAETLAIPMQIDNESAEQDLYFINKLLQRLVLLPSDGQEAVWNEVVAAYEDAVREMAAQGRHPRRARELDGTWRIAERQLFEPGDAFDGPVFGRAVTLTTIECEREMRPLKEADVFALVKEARLRHHQATGLRGQYFADAAQRIRGGREESLAAALPKRFASVEAALRAPGTNSVKAAAERIAGLVDVLVTIEPGVTMTAVTEDNEVAEAVVVDVRRPSEDEVHLPGRWLVRYAMPGDEAVREISIATMLRDPRIILYRPKGGRPEFRYPQFDRVPSGTMRVQRRLMDGNLLSAVRSAAEGGAGSMVAWRDDEGRRRRGILLPKGRQNRLETIRGRTTSTEAVARILAAGGRLRTDPDNPKDGAELRLERGQVVLAIGGSKAAEKLFATQDLVALVGDFQQNWQHSWAPVPQNALASVVAAIAAKGCVFYYEGNYRKHAVAAAVEEKTRSGGRAPAAEPEPERALVPG